MPMGGKLLAPPRPDPVPFVLRKKQAKMATDREECVYMAKLAEQAERYDEMVEEMKKVSCSSWECQCSARPA